MTIKLKRSDVQGKVPGVLDLELGEIALNTYDGKGFFKTDDNSGNQTMVQIGTIGNDKTGTTDIVTDIWSGTQAQYDALAVYDPETLYFIKP